MLLTIPFTELMRIETVPAAIIENPLGGPTMRLYRAIDPVDRETPLITVAHCPSCPRRGAEVVRACGEVACPCRERRVA